MKNYFFLFALIILTSCGISGEATLSGPDVSNSEELQGTFSSKKGVMSPLSCHGYNIGHLKTSEGQNVVVCFDRLPNSSELQIPESVHVTGHYEQHTVVATDDNPCPTETITIFYAESWHAAH